MVSALRAVGAEVTRARALVDGRGAATLATMGMPTYEALDPTGWSDRGADWLPNPGSHLARMNFALGLVSQTHRGGRGGPARADRRRGPLDAGRGHRRGEPRIFGGTLPPDVARRLPPRWPRPDRLPAGFRVVGVALASPAFQVK